MKMRCLQNLPVGLFLLLSPLTGYSTSVQDSGLSTKIINIEHATIICNNTFEDTRAALEASLPPINTTYATLLAAGDVRGALLALESLPTLSTFIVPPRDFGNLLRTLNKTGKAVQYEIGNPLTATRLNSFELAISLYAPIRVLLREKNGVAMFEYDRPRSTMGQFGNDGVDKIAQALDRNLTALLMTAAGW
ncbi:hypothetical protein diail_1983 [Diaporthe ilicicola]|nr:hypothetical protein diail_1983 [Diaporthe ilicicola]